MSYFVFLLLISHCLSVPILVLHGMGDSCHDHSATKFVDSLKTKLPSEYITSLCLGKTALADKIRGVIDSLNKQVERICDIIQR